MTTIMSQQERQRPSKRSPRRTSVGDYRYNCCGNSKNNDDSYDEKLIHLAKIRDILNAPSPVPADDFVADSTNMNGKKKGSSSIFPRPLSRAKTRQMQIQFLGSDSTEQPSSNLHSKQPRHAPGSIGREKSCERNARDGSDCSSSGDGSGIGYDSTQGSGSSRCSSIGSVRPLSCEGHQENASSSVCSSDRNNSPSLKFMETSQNWESRGTLAANSCSKKSNKTNKNCRSDNNDCKSKSGKGGTNEIMDKYFECNEDFYNPSFWSKKIKEFQSSSINSAQGQCREDDGDATAPTAACSTVGTATAPGLAAPSYSSSPSRRTDTQSRTVNGKHAIGKQVAFASKFDDSVSSLEISSQSILIGYGSGATNGIGFNNNFVESENACVKVRTNSEIILEEERTSASESASTPASDSITNRFGAPEIIDQESNFGAYGASTASKAKKPKENVLYKPYYSPSSDRMIDCGPPSGKNDDRQLHLRPKFKPSSSPWCHEDDDDGSHPCDHGFEYANLRLHQIEDSMDSFLLGTQDNSDGKDVIEDSSNKIRADLQFDLLRDEDDLFAEDFELSKIQASNRQTNDNSNASRQHVKLEQTPVPSTLTAYCRKRSETPNNSTNLYNSKNQTSLRRASDGGPPISSIIIIPDSQNNNHKNRRSSSNDKDKRKPIMARISDKNNNNNNYHYRTEEQSDQETISKINKLIEEYHKFLEDGNRVCSRVGTIMEKDSHQSSGSRMAGADNVAGKTAESYRKSIRIKDEHDTSYSAAASTHINPNKKGRREQKSAALTTTATTSLPIHSTHLSIATKNKAMTHLVDSITSTTAQAAYYIDNSFTRKCEAQKPPIPAVIWETTSKDVDEAATNDAHSTKINNHSDKDDVRPSSCSARRKKDNHDGRRISSDAPSSEDFDVFNGQSAKRFVNGNGRSAAKSRPSQRKVELTTVEPKKRVDRPTPESKPSSFRRHSADCQSTPHCYSPIRDKNKTKSIDYNQYQQRRSSDRDDSPVTKSEGNILHERSTVETRLSRNDEEMNVQLHTQSQLFCYQGLGNVTRRLSADIVMEKRMARQGDLEAAKLNPFAYF
ncbi:hypothetical protein ACHAXS_003471 [Conticribra weissflogii]